MAKIYARLIMQGKMKIEEVPERWRDATAELVNSVGGGVLTSQ